MRIFLSGLWGLFLAFTLSAGEWQEVRFQGKSYKVYVMDLRKGGLELRWKNNDGEPLRNFNQLKRQLSSEGKELTFAMNAGIFNPQLQPVGLYIEHGKELRPLTLAEGQGNIFLKPNGVFYIDDQRKAAVITSEKYKAATTGKQISYATQSGPQLLIDGKVHPAFREGSSNQLVRNGVGVIDEHTVVFIMSQAGVNFYEFASLFKEKYGCENALYLDGVISQIYTDEDADKAFRSNFSAMIAGTRPLNTLTEVEQEKPAVQKSIPLATAPQSVHTVSLPLDKYWFDLDLTENVKGPQRFWSLYRQTDRKLKLALTAGSGFSEPGLIIFNGKPKAELTEGDSLNGGVFYITRKNDVGLLSTADYKKHYTDSGMIKHAFQSAKLLVQNGTRTLLNQEVMHYSGVGWNSKNNSLVFMSTEGLSEMSLNEFADLFVDKKCDIALLLSSGAYTQIFINGQRSDLDQKIADKVPVLISGYSK